MEHIKKLKLVFNAGMHKSPATDFDMVVSNICRSSKWNLLHVTVLTPRILKSFPYFWKICALRFEC
jgi:hypothetical protein